VTDIKTPANDEAGTTDTKAARKRVLKARMARIAFAPCFSDRVGKRCRQIAGTICINATPKIMLLAG
jgi:hypothetical protein